MTVKECYESFGGDYEGVMSRLAKEERIIKYAGKFVNGTDYQSMLDALAAGDKEASFRGAHNLKGVSANLGFTPLFDTSSTLCEALRPGNPPVEQAEIDKMLENVKAAYAEIIAALKTAGIGE